MASPSSSPTPPAFSNLQRSVLAFLRVPPEPHPPAGDPASLRVFRAGRNYYRLRMAGWAATQLVALAAIVFWTSMLLYVEAVVRDRQAGRVVAPVSPTANGNEATASNEGGDERWRKRFTEHVDAIARAAEKSARTAPKGTGRIGTWMRGYRQALVEIGLLLPTWAFLPIWVLKILGILLYLVQLPITYAVRRLDYEMRWYMVTDRSLRLRHGIWKVAETTMSFANLQQVTVTQDPLQRMLGLSDVKVQSAGGAGAGEHEHHHGEDMHVGLFHSVTNAAEIRDLILERLRRFRESGLGDPDEAAPADSGPAGVAPGGAGSESMAAAQEVLAEARALRAAAR